MKYESWIRGIDKVNWLIIWVARFYVFLCIYSIFSLTFQFSMELKLNKNWPYKQVGYQHCFNQKIRLVSNLNYQIIKLKKKLKTFYQGTYLFDKELSMNKNSINLWKKEHLKENKNLSETRNFFRLFPKTQL